MTDVRNDPTERHARLRPVLMRKQGLALAVLVVATLGAAPLVSAFYQAPAEASPESGTAQVAAQGVMDLSDGDLRWQVTDRVAQLPGNAEPVESEQGFVVVQSGVLLLEDAGTGNQYRLPAGEAVLTSTEASQERVALGSDVAAYHDVALVSSDEAVPADETVIYASEPFAGPGARHDIDLLQNALPAGGQWSLPAGNLPTLVLVDAGAADIATESGDVVSLGAGEAAAFSGQIIVTAGGDGANVSAVEVGPPVPLLTQVAQAAAATPTASTTGATPEARVIDVEGEEAAPAASPEAGDEQEGNDADDDALNDRREAELGTDPSLADTDEDGLTDGAEVREHSTNPLAADSDTDGVLDGDEVTLGTDPNDPDNGAPAADAAAVTEEAPAPVEEPAPPVEEVPAPVEEAVVVVDEAPAAAAPGDTDGDGLEDAIEFELGTDAYTVDTDQDGLTDGDEYYIFVTGTLNPDTDGDGILDGDEAAQGTDPNIFN